MGSAASSLDEESKAALQVLRTLHTHSESAQLNVSPRLDFKPRALQVDARVKAFWDGLVNGADGSGWYPGTIVGVMPFSASAQLRYAVRYDDGFIDKSVAPSHVRLVGSPERVRAATLGSAADREARRRKLCIFSRGEQKIRLG